jgi:hypothetical protein
MKIQNALSVKTWRMSLAASMVALPSVCVNTAIFLPFGRGGKGVAVPDQGKNGIQGSGPRMDQCANISSLPERFCVCVVAFLQQLPGCYNR